MASEFIWDEKPSKESSLLGFILFIIQDNDLYGLPASSKKHEAPICARYRLFSSNKNNPWVC